MEPSETRILANLATHLGGEMKSYIEYQNLLPGGGYHKPIQTSKRGANCINPIRIILETLEVKPNPEKPLINISQGDPTLYNLFPIDDALKKAVIKVVESGQNNSYVPSAGMETALKAISKLYESEGVRIDSKSIFMTTGCTQALLWAIESVADKGDHILFPKPCFPIYKTFAQMNGIEFSCYDLLPDKNWEVDLEHLITLVTPKTKAILINNPSNPCGSVFTKQHILDILQVASLFSLPIILDEVYAHFVFPGHRYHSVTTFSTDVPILICNSLSKRYIVPGWRIGWLAVYDPTGCMNQVRDSINRFSQASFGVNSMIQAALPDILENTPSSYFERAVNYTYENAKIICDRLSSVPGIRPIMPHGSMFMMVQIYLAHYPSFNDEFEIVEKLIQQESVFPFPSSIFGINGYLRISLIIPKERALEAADRMAEFFTRHYVS